MIDNMSTLKKLVFLYHIVASKTKEVIKTITDAIPPIIFHAIAKPIVSLTQKGKMELVPVTYNTAITQYGKNEFVPKAYVDTITQEGKCEQNGTPTPDVPVDILCNNGVLKARRQSGLPLGYQMVEWLKLTGAVTITGFKTKSTQEIETVFYRERSGAAYLYSSDTATSGTTNTTAYLTSGAGNWRWDGKSYSISVPTGIKITSIQNKDGVWLNGTRYGYYTDAGDFVSTNDLRLSSSENSTIRFCSQTIREGEQVTLNLVSVQRLSDSAYGFYDKVSGNFYTNADATFDAGDPIPDPVEIYTDGEDEVLTVSGKNLFDPTKVLFGYYRDFSTGNKRTSSVNFVSSDDGYIPCLPNTAYTFVGTNKTDGTYSKYNTIYFFDSAKNYLGASSYQISQPTTGTTPSNCRYLQVRSNPLDTVSVSIQEAFQRFNWQLELGSTATDYEPYHAQTVTVPMLLGVDTVKDEVELIHGPLTHRIGLYVIKGTDDEGWAENISYSGTFYADCLPSSALITTISLFTRYEGVLGSRSVASMNNGTAKCGSSSNRQRIFIRDTSCADVDALKAKLSGFYADGAPCIVAFALATETTEQTTPQIKPMPSPVSISYTAEIDDITITTTQSTHTDPMPYAPLDILANNGALKWNGSAVVTDGNPEVLSVGSTNVSVQNLFALGDTQDTKEFISGLVTHKIGVKVLNGSDTWSLSDGVFTTALSDASASVHQSTPPICERFIGVNGSVSVSNMPEGSIRIAQHQILGSSAIFIKSSLFADVSSLNAFLTEYPCIVLYALSNETTETIDPHPEFSIGTASISYSQLSGISLIVTRDDVSVPTPYTPVFYKCNNGVLRWNGSSIIVDGTPEVLTVSGENLMSRDGETTGKIINSTGTVSENSNYCISAPFMLSAGDYVCTWNVGASSSRPFSVFACEADGTPKTNGMLFYQLRSENGINTGEFTVPQATLAVSSYRSNATDLTISAVQTASVPMLLGVGDYKDEVELVSGLLTHRIGIMVFDGSEDWRQSSSANIYILDSTIAVGLTAICTHFLKVSNTTSASNMPNGSFKGHNSNTVLYFKDVYAGNVNNFKASLAAQYAAGTPVIMLYALSTETTEQITPQALNANEGTNVIDISAEVDDITLSLSYYDIA